MSLLAVFVVVILSVAGIHGLPNSFKYEVKKAENFVHEFEMAGGEAKPGVKERKVTLKAFSWTDCGKPTDIVHIEQLSVQPDPLGFPGPLTIAANFTLKEDLSPNLSVDLLVEKKILGAYIKIPCIDNFGSCTYSNLCDDLVSIKSECPEIVEKLIGNQCQCPIKQATYVLPKSTIDVEASLIPLGDYKIKANVTKNGKPAACLEVTLSIV